MEGFDGLLTSYADIKSTDAVRRLCELVDSLGSIIPTIEQHLPGEDRRNPYHSVRKFLMQDLLALQVEVLKGKALYEAADREMAAHPNRKRNVTSDMIRCWHTFGQMKAKVHGDFHAYLRQAVALAA